VKAEADLCARHVEVRDGRSQKVAQVHQDRQAAARRTLAEIVPYVEGLTPERREKLLEGHWKDRAACVGVDPSTFFPERGESTDPAVTICGGCDVRQECLAQALLTIERFGIWGGASERQRRDIRRTLRLREITNTANDQEVDSAA
jgi:WhiB family redox-sensing transcriptional regulator